MIYLDNAATTFPKPVTVPREMYKCMTEYCGNAGRSGHSLSLMAANKIYECRCRLSELFGVSDPSKIIFTQNTTHALNLVIKGLLGEGEHAIISDMEHNSVLRPIQKLADRKIISYSLFNSRTLDEKRNPTLICSQIARLIQKNTKMVICNHSSNICSASLPIAQIGDFCHRHGILFVVDAAQSAGVLPLNVEKMKIDALCVPAHKGLYGPQGCGFVALGENVTPDTLLEGGSGTNSLEAVMPDASPERYEAGTLATPAIAGLCEGVKFVGRIGVEAIREYECELYKYTLEQLRNIKGVKIYADNYVGSTMLLNIDGHNSEELSRKLNEAQICTRGGYHCAPLAHKVLGTFDEGGLRVSFGIFNKKMQIDLLAKELNEISK